MNNKLEVSLSPLQSLDLSRRRFLKSVAVGGVGGLMASQLPVRRAAAATDLTILCWQGYEEPLKLGSFLADNGAVLQSTILANNDEIITKLSAGQQIDIVTPYMGYVPAMREAGLIQPIDQSKVPNLMQVMPLFKDDANLNYDGKLWSTPFTWGGAPMVYDPKKFPTPPDSWKIVLEPEYRGKFVMMDDPIGQMIIASILLKGPENPTMATPAELKEIVDWLIKLKKEHARMLAPTFGEAADAVVRGDVLFTYGGAEAMKAWVSSKGIVDFMYPKEGSYGFIDNYCIPANAPNPDLAHAACNQVLSATAQAHLGNNLLQGVVTSEGVAGLEPQPKSIYPYDDMKKFSDHCKFYPMTPFESDGTHATWPEWLAGWQQVLAA